MTRDSHVLTIRKLKEKKKNVRTEKGWSVGISSERRERERKKSNTNRFDIKMAKSCKGLAMELVKCLSETDCVKVEKRSYKECAGENSPCISTECIGLRETFFNCKRGQVDMRARIRGNKGY